MTHRYYPPLPKLVSDEYRIGVAHMEVSQRALSAFRALGVVDAHQVAEIGDEWIRQPNVGKLTFQDIRLACEDMLGPHCWNREYSKSYHKAEAA